MSHYYIRQYGRSFSLYNRHTRRRVSAWDNWRLTMEILKEQWDQHDQKTQSVAGNLESSRSRCINGYKGPL